jgi:hypothetical protein
MWTLRTVDDIAARIAGDSWRMRVLAAARSLDLPDWWIGAGFVRNAVWDAIHGYAVRTPLSDIDVISFDPRDLDEASEKRHEATLAARMPNVPWSVKNQARMHLVNGDAPYANSTDALARWPETATCIAVRLGQDNHLVIAAPHGIDDLAQLVVRVSPGFVRDPAIFEKRVRDKRWMSRWPKLTIVHP